MLAAARFAFWWLSGAASGFSAPSGGSGDPPAGTGRRFSRRFSKRFA